MSTEKVDLLLKYILALAARNDRGERDLGPIHLVKYVYLADLAYARKTGRTFTGVRWRFHHFGPWSEEVYKRIKSVVTEIQAKEIIIQNPKIEDDIVRYRLETGNEELLIEQIEKVLPLEIVLPLKEMISKYGNDTSSLLHYVYITKPMLKAAPGEELDFSVEYQEQKETQDLSAVKEKKIPPDRLQKIREEIQKRLKEKRKHVEKEYVEPQPPPIYDEVYFKGLEELEKLDREIEDLTGEYMAEFSDSVWKSKARYDPELS